MAGDESARFSLGTYVVTHRCQERRFLLRFANDRRQYRLRLFEATQRFPLVKILDYAITSNHVHLLAWVRRMQGTDSPQRGADTLACLGRAVTP